MIIKKRKIALIQWVTNLEDEYIIDQLRNASGKNLPDEIVTLLKKSDSFREDQCIEHTSARDLINSERD